MKNINTKTKCAMAYMVGAWLTFGHSSTFIGDPVPYGSGRWTELETAFTAICWPLYWFCKSAMLVFGAGQ